MDFLRRLSRALKPIEDAPTTGTTATTHPPHGRGTPGAPRTPAAPAPPAPGPAARAGEATLSVGELARRIGMSEHELRSTPVSYRSFAVPKRGGGSRTISAPDPALRDVQRRILGRLLARLESHPAAIGFEPTRSLVEHASLHTRRAVVLRMDVRDFFASTPAVRVSTFFASLGWNPDATSLLVGLCTWDGSLPQGAPTSPRLSNLLNRRLDARLTGVADTLGATYTRYADDLTFSFDEDDPGAVHRAIRFTKQALADDGYMLHERRKLHVRRRYERQIVSGLVVNEGARLPRERRRWLRSVEHHARVGLPVTLAPQQLAGWRAFSSMVERGVGIEKPRRRARRSC